jgi:hypothetical protein
MVVLVVGGSWYGYDQYQARKLAEVEAVLPPVPTLSPALFVGRAREAYQVAHDIPDVLKHVPCFCGCKDAYQHQNNLFCFADQHGAVCDMCQSIALESKRLHDEGKSTSEIAELIQQKYGQGER